MDETIPYAQSVKKAVNRQNASVLVIDCFHKSKRSCHCERIGADDYIRPCIT